MLRKIAQQHGGGCLMIVRRKDDGGVEFVGSGFLCHSKGYLLTCAHSINLTDKLAIIPPQPINDFTPLTLERVNVIDVSVAQYNAENDVALLKITAPQPLVVPENLFGDENRVMVGTSVAYFGYPFGQSGLHVLKISSSIISAKVLSNNTKQFQLDAMVHEGNSGGPLVDLTTGQIIGIISGRFSPTGNAGGVRIGGYALGTESSISYATTISYGKDLLISEGLNV
ncbi:MAG: serine protease [Gallionella sp.]|nr:serine protease [Gallionella sp.]